MHLLSDALMQILSNEAVLNNFSQFEKWGHKNRCYGDMLELSEQTMNCI